ncbi:unnamed protein product, partial [Ectocarpus sp. 13 AM-2016]
PAFKREPIRRAWDRRSTAWSARGNITYFAREEDCVEPLTLAPCRDRGAGQGPKEGGEGRKGAPVPYSRLATPRAVFSREELFPHVDDISSAGWKILNPPA